MMVAVNECTPQGCGSAVQYLLTDHLGSTVAVTNQSGTLTSQQRYLPFGEERAIPNSPILATDFGYTGQRLLDSGMGGIMDYKARFYLVGLGRFIQPDGLIPYPALSQSWNRYTYVFNNPTNFIDPSGHTGCDGDYRGTCSQMAASLAYQTKKGKDKPGCGVASDNKNAFGFHCTTDDLDGATLKQRLEWFDWLTENMDENIKPGTSDWFINIKTVVWGFVATGQDDNNWVLTVDANILVAVQDGYVASIGLDNGARRSLGASLWLNFFLSLTQSQISDEELIGMWGLAEQAGTNEGMNRAALLGFGGGYWRYINWLNTDFGRDDLVFVMIGDLYRGSGKTICTKIDCVNSFFDPRKTTPIAGLSPVMYAEIPVYFNDYIGFALTGH